MPPPRPTRRPPSDASTHAVARVTMLRAAGSLVLLVATATVALLRPKDTPLPAPTSALSASPAPTTRFPWQSVDGKHWLIAATDPPSAAPQERTAEPGCAPGMVRARGRYVLDRQGGDSGEVERLQDEACTSWIGRDFPARCRTFDAAKLTALLAPLPRRDVDVCIDRFEYPNVEGAFPMIVVTYREAAALCARDDKRLCSEREWTFACEGPEARPYPYGYARDASACVIDQPWREFNGAALRVRDSAVARDELDRLWQGVASGARPECRSVFGVHDMTGNVDEWTTTTRRGAKWASVLKGGYWGPVRARCRPATRAHDEQYVGYQQGFRCCADPAPSSAPSDGGTRARGDRDAGALDDDGGASAPGDGTAAESTGEDDDDEQQALASSRGPGLACRAEVAPASPGVPRSLAPLALASALLVLRRRRRRRDAGGEDGTRTHV